VSDDTFWKTSGECKPLTAEDFEKAYAALMAAEERPSIEYHHSRCPKITSGCVKACRCGTAPLEAALEDAP
jgi:hypothetical protein